MVKSLRRAFPFTPPRKSRLTMPFFAHTPPPKPENKPAVVRKEKQPAKNSNAGQARTLLPMTGTSKAGAAGSANGAGSKAVGSTSAAGVQGPVKVLIPNDAQTPAKTVIPAAAGGGGGDKKLKWVHETYFDAGAQDLIGTFTTQIIRYGVRYEQHEIHVYGRNETLDTRGTNLPYQSIVAGTSAGLAYRYWLPDNHVFATVSYGHFFSGNNKGKDDFRVGLAGYYDWKSEKSFTDIYGDFFYIDLQKDTYATARIRSGLILHNLSSGPITGYGVLQAFADGKGDSGTTNRVEGGFGIGYLYQKKVSLNIELRAGYAYRGIINNRTYLNPMIVVSGSL